MVSISPMPNTDPVQNYSLNFIQKAEGVESCLGQSKTSLQETGAAHVTSQTSIKETCADTLSISPSQAFFFTQRTIPTTERKWKVIPASSLHRGALPTAVSKMVTRMVRHYLQGENNLTQRFIGHDKASTAESVRKTWSTRFLRKKTLASTYSSRKQQDEVRVLRGFQNISWLTSEQFKDTLVEWQLTLSCWGTFWFLTIGRNLFFTGAVLSASNPSQRTDSFQWERKARKDGRLSSSHHLTLLLVVPMKKNTVMITQFLKTCTITAIGNVIRMPSIG